jgi:acyl-CoA dehydrogenase
MRTPSNGSDLAGIRTTAVLDGDHYILNGAKTFITGGLLADLVIVVARTSTDPDNRRRGLTLLVVEDGGLGHRDGRQQRAGGEAGEPARRSATSATTCRRSG